MVTQETESLFRTYTDARELTQHFHVEAQEAERQHRRQAHSASLFNQREWFLNKLQKLSDETRESVQGDDDDNHLLHVCYCTIITHKKAYRKQLTTISSLHFKRLQPTWRTNTSRLKLPSYGMKSATQSTWQLLCYPKIPCSVFLGPV